MDWNYNAFPVASHLPCCYTSSYGPTSEGASKLVEEQRGGEQNRADGIGSNPAADRVPSRQQPGGQSSQISDQG